MTRKPPSSSVKAFYPTVELVVGSFAGVIDKQFFRVELSIDIDDLAKHLAYKALRSKSGRATLLRNNICLRILK